MIDAFLILDKETGEVLFEKVYDEGMRERLKADQLSSIALSLRFMAHRLRRRNVIKVAGHKWAYYEWMNLLFVMISDYNEKNSWLKGKLLFLKKKLQDIFQEFLDSNPMMAYPLKALILHPEISKTFSRILDDTVDSWITAEKMAEEAKSMDILEVFQQVMSILYDELPEDQKKDFRDTFLKILDRYKIRIDLRGDNFNIIDMKLYLNDHRKLRVFLSEVLFHLLTLVKKCSDAIKFKEVLYTVSLVVRKEIKRVNSYNLYKYIMLPFLKILD
ncbi:MAG: hypothetical protein J7L50_01130 [Candidatus Odinarchaeota archaeon]|nr:hypothetical protein [Candidatus Odinarchaeota archaeon]